MAAAVGVIAQAVMPVVMNVVAGVAANFISNFLSGMLDGAPNAGGAEGICSKMQTHDSNDFRNATINSLNTMHVDAAKDALNRLCNDYGMPKFVRDDAHKAFDQVLKQYHQECNPATQNALIDCVKQDIDNKTKNIADQLLQYVEDMLKDRLEGETRGCGGNGGDGKKISARSWIAAIAEALGKVQGQKAGEMMSLTEKVSDISENQIKHEKDSKGVDAEDAQEMKNYNSEKSKLAAEMTQAQAELQGVQQEFKLISETTSTLLKTLGETLSGMARKQ